MSASAPLFAVVTLPGIVQVLDAETTGNTILVRRPSRVETRELERAAHANDHQTVLTICYGLAEFKLADVLALSPAARIILDDAIEEQVRAAKENLT